MYFVAIFKNTTFQHASTSNWQTPGFLTVPDTPRSIKQKLLEMQQAKQNGMYVTFLNCIHFNQFLFQMMLEMWSQIMFKFVAHCY